jgi:hypothetical protein
MTIALIASIGAAAIAGAGAFVLFRQRNQARKRCQLAERERLAPSTIVGGTGIPYDEAKRRAAEYCGTYPGGLAFTPPA